VTDAAGSIKSGKIGEVQFLHVLFRRNDGGEAESAG
jgi:hypothetical protein